MFLCEHAGCAVTAFGVPFSFVCQVFYLDTMEQKVWQVRALILENHFFNSEVRFP